MSKNRPLDVITGGTSLPVLGYWTQSQVIDTQARLRSELLFADPILPILANYHRELKVTRYLVRHLDSDRVIANMIHKNYVYKGISYLRTRKSNKDWGPINSWNPRRSLGLYGTTGFLPAVPKTLGSIVGGWSDPVYASGLNVPLTRYKVAGISYDHCGFDDLYTYLSDLKLRGDSIFFRRTTTFSRYGHLTLTGISLTEDTISYRLKNVFWQSYPSSRSMRCNNVNVTIKRNVSSSFQGLSITHDFSRITVDNTPSLGEPQWLETLVIQPRVSLATRYETDVLIGGAVFAEKRRLVLSTLSGAYGGLLGAYPMPMRIFAPGLFHSQAEALRVVMLDYGSNFENLIQAPQLLELLQSLYTEFPVVFKKLFAGGDAFRDLPRRAKLFTEVISGTILARDFAISPSYRALMQLIDKMRLPNLGEAFFTISGTQSTWNSEHSTFRTAVMQGSQSFLGFSDSTISKYHVIFGTTVRTSLTYSEVAMAILKSNPLLALHAYPTPSGVWDYLGGSFIVDYGLKIGDLISDNEAYNESVSVPLRIGHSVALNLEFNDGRKLSNFWRSIESSLPLDPPGNTWNPGATLPPITIPLGIQQLFRWI